MGESDLYFGYGVSYLRQVSDGGGYAMYVPSATIYYSEDQANQQAAETGEQPEPAGAPPETPAPDSDEADGLDIATIKDQIMGEQPGTTLDRANTWSNVAMMLFTVKNDLYNQTVDLEAKWESPEAKNAFLRKVGETLAYAQVWREAAQDNSAALSSLSAEMTVAQSKMRTLWSEYQQSLTSAAENYASHAGGRGGAQRTEEQRQQQIETIREADSLPNIKSVKNEYDQKARELASETANAYAPIIQKLQAGRAKMMDPLNAVMHPGAYGGPLPPAVPTGGPGGAPPGAPSTFSTPTAAPSFNGGMPGRGGGAPPNPQAAPAPQTAPPAPTAPTPPGSPGAPVAPVAPLAPRSGPTAAKNVPRAPVLSPSATNPGPLLPGAPGTAPPAPGAPGSPRAVPPALNTGGPGTMNGLGMPGGTPGTPPNGFGSTPKGGTPYPPGTIGPPPGGGVPNKPQQRQGRVLGAPPGGPGAPGFPGTGGEISNSMPPPVPPGGGGPQNRNREPAGPLTPGFTPHPETPEAFQPPPPPTPPVLDNGKRIGKRNRKAAADAAAGTAGPAAPGATPPVLANPRLPGQDKQNQRPNHGHPQHRKDRKLSEFESGTPTGTAPVFEGRVGPTRTETDAMAGDVPTALRGPTPVAATEQERHAQPTVYADRTARTLLQPEHGPGAEGRPVDPATWEVETPGGPVVAGSKEPQYRAESAPALGSKR